MPVDCLVLIKLFSFVYRLKNMDSYALCKYSSHSAGSGIIWSKKTDVLFNSSLTGVVTCFQVE